MTLLLFALLVGQVAAPPVDSAPPLPAVSAPAGVTVADTPNDAGKSITVSWQAAGDVPVEGWLVERTPAGGAPEVVTELPGTETGLLDEGATNGVAYTYRVGAVAGADTVWSEPSATVRCSPQLFNTNRINILIGMVVFFALVVYYIDRAKRGHDLFIRRIAGLEAVDEAVGRATEMGRPILYVPGPGRHRAHIATIASLNILGEIAKKTAQYGTPTPRPQPRPDRLHRRSRGGQGGLHGGRPSRRLRPGQRLLPDRRAVRLRRRGRRASWCARSRRPTSCWAPSTPSR